MKEGVISKSSGMMVGGDDDDEVTAGAVVVVVGGVAVGEVAAELGADGAGRARTPEQPPSSCGLSVIVGGDCCLA